MDSTNLKSTEQYLELDLGVEVYLPIPVSPPSSTKPTPNLNVLERNSIRFAWIGRICDFKFYILCHFLKNLNEYQNSTDLKLYMTIVGTGDYLPRLKQFVKQCPNISIEFKDFVAPIEMESFIENEVDVVTSMGTAAFEGAKRGVPTLLLDVYYDTVPDGYVFQWVYERKGFTLGDIIEPADLVVGNNSFNQKMEDLQKHYKKTGGKCHDYYQKNHSLPQITNDLLAVVDVANFTHQDLVEGGFAKRGALYNLLVWFRDAFR